MVEDNEEPITETFSILKLYSCCTESVVLSGNSSILGNIIY